MANRSLCFLGSTTSASAPGVVWSRDSHFEEHTDELALLAREVGELTNTSPADKNAEVARFVTEEMSRPQSVALPLTLSEQREVFLSALIVWRAHLPFGFLRGTLLPLLVMPGETRATLIVPGRFWGDALKNRKSATLNSCINPKWRLLRLPLNL